MALTLSLIASTHVPLEVEGLIPALTRAMSLRDIERYPIFHGNAQLPLAEFFTVTGDPTDGTMVFTGDLSGVHWLGAKMTAGVMRIEGNAGRHVGSQMRGGQIEVRGNVGDWAGSEMHGGLLRVRGNAGQAIGGAYRGSAKGMTRGTILVHGNAGNEVGHTMRRGLIAIGGSAGDFVGFNMRAGTIVVAGQAGIGHGAHMRRGTIAFLADKLPPMLPSFKRLCRYRPQFLDLLWRQLKQLEFNISDAVASAEYELFAGDLIEGGRGEILLRAH